MVTICAPSCDDSAVCTAASWRVPVLAMEIAQRAPLAAVVESLRYENPIELILGGAAALLGGFAALPALVDRLQNWKSHKRNANALADQEESRVRQSSYLKITRCSRMTSGCVCVV
jgi:hypothetical protein